MSFPHRLRTLAVCLGALALMLAFSGCEDPQARSAAADSAKAVSELRAELETLKSQNKELLAALKTIPEKLAQQISERIDRVNDQIMTTSKDLLDKVSKDAEQTRSTATTIAQNTRGDFDKELQTVKTALAGDITKLRDDMQKANEDLKKYLDNQLRELYPYAYQPRRESKSPPEPDAK